MNIGETTTFTIHVNGQVNGTVDEQFAERIAKKVAQAVGEPGYLKLELPPLANLGSALDSASTLRSWARSEGREIDFATALAVAALLGAGRTQEGLRLFAS